MAVCAVVGRYGTCSGVPLCHVPMNPPCCCGVPGDGGNEEGMERTFIEQQPQPDFCTDQAAFPPWFFSQQNTPTGGWANGVQGQELG